MKVGQHFWSWVLVLQLSGLPALLAQPVIIQPGAFGNQQALGSGVENLRVSGQNADHTEAQFTMDYSYDGFSGPTAQLLPVIGKKGQTGVSGWFGADPVMVGRGRGTITLKVRYFNDEPGVPAQFTSDQLRIFIMNQTGTVLLMTVPFLKTINWGSPSARPEQRAVPPIAMVDRASAEKVAQEKRAAEEKAKQEVAAREQARLKAEAEVRTRKEAEQKALAEAAAREEALKKAQAEAERIARETQKAEELRLAQEKAAAEQKALAEAQEKARKEAEAKALADTKAAAEAKRLAEAKAAAEAKARAEAKAVAEAKALSEAKALAEAKAREEARLKAEAEEKRLVEEKRLAEAKALAEVKARKEAEEKAYQEALAQAKAELAAKKLAEEKAQAEAVAQASAPVAAAAPVSLDIATDKKTKVTNVDVVNRSMDRTQMTFGVEFEYRDQLSEPMVGVDILRDSEPQVSQYFVSRPMEIGKSRRNFALLPVKFQPPANLSQSGDFGTDKVVVYLTDKKSQRYNIHPATMLLRWRASGRGSSTSPVAATSNSVEIEDFKQNDPASGYVGVNYNLLSGKAKLRARIYDAAMPSSAAYFTSKSPEIQAGRGVQIVDVFIDAEARTPSDLVRADTIEIELVDPAGKVLARSSKKAAMVWTRPRQ